MNRIASLVHTLHVMMMQSLYVIKYEGNNSRVQNSVQAVIILHATISEL